MKAYEIINYLENYFPLELQMDFDCCGLQIGNRNKEIKKVYIALNADNETLQACIEQDCQMLITHHPFLLEKIKNMDVNEHQGYFISLAMRHDIVVYSLHTCLDRGQNGISMNDWLVNQLGVHDVECYDHYEVGKKAILNQPMEGHTFIKKVKETFHLEHVKYSKNTNKIIEKIAICGGSAADDLEILADQVDCYITGDSKYRHAKYAIDHDCLLIDPGHHLEVIFEKELQKLLNNLPVDTQIHESKDYFKYE
ncbi:Nif3-like dinuclear metal center hexameric protein [Faecalibacillus faecis]|uniref:Nif3-like dinuclear metal center hexameric protein n=1 Tax=Faecalibacillus faecis TaxID=1982628 RepID=UPI0038641D1D